MVDYCTTAQIKIALQIDSDDESYDTELEGIRDQQEAIIDNALSLYTTTPLTAVTTGGIIEGVCIELCRVAFRFRKAADSEALNVLCALRKMALADLQRYIEIEYLSEAAIVIEEDRDDYE